MKATILIKPCFLGFRHAGAVVRALASHQCGAGFPDSASCVDWVCWFSTLLQEVFLQVLPFPPLLKKQYSSCFDLIRWFQFTVSPICAPVLERLDTYIKFLFSSISYVLILIHVPRILVKDKWFV